MGFFNELKKAVSNPGEAISNLGSKIDDEILQPVSNELSGLDDFVNENVPGGWAGVIMIAAGVYYAPEIGAYFSASGAPLTAAEASAITAEAGTSAAATELTAAEVNAIIASEQAAGLTAAEVNALIAEEAAASAAASSAAAAATPAQVAAANAAGMSVLDYVKAGFLVNAITGDPLKLAGDQPSGGGGGFAGFEQVPIPADWRSPTYAASSAPIDLSSIFTDQNLLAGTQWQGLPTQQPNISFNDIFASGQQQTPMGNMVDINQIVSAILGQNTASQKSA
jgi:hypothetical protein